ncbi:MULTISPECIES: DUF488 domain-containing protein [Idiomarina]|uniref:DUF488 domain-containing protein n=1 Tax=Idiomarinaceae TaxID=267893 RepID=UPI00129CE601|nr:MULTISPECIES: DUF488 family protein [unclassified Idiomarina]MRJ42599.1 DUF488 family protein [Idiomarina sp. FeN1]NCU57981.1 DUF488 family protein [Idiomarina sp. FenA--70]NCU60533.1 DUF488 family protein [Idiomarina sp. FenBw--71]
MTFCDKRVTRLQINDAIKLKRVYDAAQSDDGKRVLADRLWPRGLSKTKAQIDLWCQAVCPSTKLRQQYHRGELSYAEFVPAYQAELAELDQPLLELMRMIRQGPITLLSAVKDLHQSHLPVLQHELIQRLHAEDVAASDEPSSPVCYGKQFDHWD